jgi:hypothetical protein
MILRGRGKISFGHARGDGAGESVEFSVGGTPAAAGPRPG